MDMELGYTLSMLNIRTPQLFKKQMVTLALISVFMALRTKTSSKRRDHYQSGCLQTHGYVNAISQFCFDIH